MLKPMFSDGDLPLAEKLMYGASPQVEVAADTAEKFSPWFSLEVKEKGVMTTRPQELKVICAQLGIEATSTRTKRHIVFRCFMTTPYKRA
jgi:hypothetical protein